jgi:hypothetical protein
VWCQEVTDAGPVEAACARAGPDQLVGRAVDAGGRGEDVAAAGEEVQVAGGQVPVALGGPGEVDVQAAAGGADQAGGAVEQSRAF